MNSIVLSQLKVFAGPLENWETAKIEDYKNHQKEYPEYLRCLFDSEKYRYNEILTILNKKYPYICKTEGDEQKIGYTQTLQKGRSELATKIKIGKFIQKFFPNLEPPIKERIQIAHNAIHKNKLIDNFGIAKTAQEILEVYENGPSSCMAQKGNERWERWGDWEAYPVEVYAAGDIGVAFLKKSDKSGYSQRTLINLNERTYSKVYGSGNLITILKSKGYEHNSQALEDCKIQKIEHNDGQFIMPYIDGGLHACTSEKMDHFILKSEYSNFYDFCKKADSVKGLLSNGDYENCYNCEDSIHIGDVFMANVSEFCYCEDCFHEIFAFCDHCNELDYGDNFVFCEFNDSYICNSCSERNYFTDAYNNQIYPNGESIEVYYGDHWEEVSQETWDNTGEFYECECCNENFHENYMEENEDGDFVCNIGDCHLNDEEKAEIEAQKIAEKRQKEIENFEVDVIKNLRTLLIDFDGYAKLKENNVLENFRLHCMQEFLIANKLVKRHLDVLLITQKGKQFIKTKMRISSFDNLYFNQAYIKHNMASIYNSLEHFHN